MRAAANRIVSDCEALLSDTSGPHWRLWHLPVGEALLAGHQLRGIAERRFLASRVVLSRDETAAMSAEMREAQHRIVQAMTQLLGLVPAGFEDELLLADARAIRDLALRLGDDAETLVPMEAAPSSAAPLAGPRGNGSAPPDAAAWRIVVVDDMEAPRTVLVRLLERLGYQVLSAANGLEALELAERLPVDLFLSDIEMPVCDGFELLRRLKANEKTRDIPVVVVSGIDDSESVVRCIELGAEDHLAKPYSSSVLQARIRASLDRRWLREHELSYLRRVAQLTVAAEEVEGDNYRPGSLANLSVQDDPLGRLARVFDRVVSGWQARESRLQRRLRQFQDEIRRSKPRPEFELEILPGFDELPVHHLFADRFEIIEELGRGGMGVVYRARDLELDEEVAVKVMRAELLKTDPGFIERLKMEIRLGRKITHPNVVRSHDFGEWEGAYYLTMEYVPGTTVDRLLETHGRLSVASTLAIGSQLGEALAVAHEQKIIHRDIKPANLLVDDEGIVKVTDFGLARNIESRPHGLTEHGSVMGTPHYMAPEQIFGGDVDARSDLFAAGAVLYECLTGAPPFDANSANEIVRMMVAGPPVAVEVMVPDVPPALAALVAQLLQYEPRDRVQSARELVERLREIG